MTAAGRTSHQRQPPRAGSNISTALDVNGNPYRTYQPTVDWRFTWMFTGQQTDTSNGAHLRRQHRHLREPAVRHRSVATRRDLINRVAGEVVVEAVFGYSGNVAAPGRRPHTLGYADRLRPRTAPCCSAGPATSPTPRSASARWIADVTYDAAPSAARTASAVIRSVADHRRSRPSAATGTRSPR